MSTQAPIPEPQTTAALLDIVTRENAELRLREQTAAEAFRAQEGRLAGARLANEKLTADLESARGLAADIAEAASNVLAAYEKFCGDREIPFDAAKKLSADEKWLKRLIAEANAGSPSDTTSERRTQLEVALAENEKLRDEVADLGMKLAHAREANAYSNEVNETEAAIDAEEKKAMRAELAARDALIAQLRDALKPFAGESGQFPGSTPLVYEIAAKGERAHITGADLKRADIALSATPETAGAELARLRDEVDSLRELVGRYTQEASDIQGLVDWREGLDLPDLVEATLDALRAQLATAETERESMHEALRREMDGHVSEHKRAEAAEARVRELEDAESISGVLSDATQRLVTELQARVAALVAAIKSALPELKLESGGWPSFGAQKAWRDLTASLADLAAWDAAKSGANDAELFTEARLREAWSTPAGLRAHVLRYGPAGYDIQSPEERADLAELRADKRRLDWLLSTDTKHIGVHADGPMFTTLCDHEGTHWSYLSDADGCWLVSRAAIDAAMAARKEGGQS